MTVADAPEPRSHEEVTGSNLVSSTRVRAGQRIFGSLIRSLFDLYAPLVRQREPNQEPPSRGLSLVSEDSVHRLGTLSDDRSGLVPVDLLGHRGAWCPHEIGDGLEPFTVPKEETGL